jgi:hypothetical protein
MLKTISIKQSFGFSQTNAKRKLRVRQSVAAATRFKLRICRATAPVAEPKMIRQVVRLPCNFGLISCNSRNPNRFEFSSSNIWHCFELRASDFEFAFSLYGPPRS